MTVHVLCITASGGLPLFARKKGEGEVLPFSIVASLNGVHMFGKSLDVLLKSTSTQESTFIWEEFENSVVLVAGASCTSEWVLRRLLQAVFNSMILLVGLEEIKSLRSSDRLKRDLRVCYPLIDHLMNSVDNGINSNMNSGIAVGSGSGPVISSGDLLGFSESILCQESHSLMTCLDTYAECMDSQYSCVLVHGREAVSTPAWTELHPTERQLLSLLAVECIPCTSSDVPVFLPYKSPTVPFRLVWVLLVPGVSVVTLCGPTPSLSEAEHLAIQCWNSSADLLYSVTQVFPRNVPSTLQLDDGILGFLLLRMDTGKYVLSCCASSPWSAGSRTCLPNDEGKSSVDCPAPSTSHRLHILRSFYHQAAAILLLNMNDEYLSSELKVNEDKAESAVEAYWCSEFHKCHGIRATNTVLCVLYVSTVPTHTMRLLTQRTLKNITTNKQLCW